MVKLYERLLSLVKEFADNSQTTFAKSIGISQSTFHGYLHDQGQSKIRLDVLGSILTIYPQVSREWLFFGEGEMLRTDAPAPAVPDAGIELEKLRQRVADLEKVIAAKEEILNAKEESLRLYRRHEAKNPTQSCKAATPVPGQADASPLQDQSSEYAVPSKPSPIE